MRFSKFSKLLFPVGLLMLFLGGNSVRKNILETQFSDWGRELPFTLESALYFDRVQQIVEHGKLPGIEPMVQYPDGIRVAEIHEIGSEYVYASLSKLLPDSMSLQQKLRVIERWVFCLSIPLIALWIFWWSGSRMAGMVSGSFAAFSISLITRSTGQELSRENSAFPLLCAHLALESLAGFAQTRRWQITARVGSMLALALALCAWDMIQFYILLYIAWHVWILIRRVGRGVPAEPPFDNRLTGTVRPTAAGTSDPEFSNAWKNMVLLLTGLLAASVFNPYLRAHHLWASPAVLLGIGGLASWFTFSRSAVAFRVAGRWWAPVAGLAIALGPVLIVTLAGPYGDNYGHFSGLLWAKIRFLNEKPVDPSLLTYEQRIMWVPALHSATWKLTKALFPASLALVSVSVCCLSVSPGYLKSSRLKQLIFLTVVSVAVFVLFVRFHVYVGLFAAGLAGLLWARAWKGSFVSRLLAALLLCFCLFTETSRAYSDAGRWGRRDVYFNELDELISWLSGTRDAGPVLASFGASCSIKAYAGKPVILHPKFETPEIRNLVRRYGELLFKSDEVSFRDFADERGALYYVHSRGEMYPGAAIYQMRYFVDALSPPPLAPVRLFESPEPMSGRYFQYVWGNNKYRVYRVLSRKDEAWAKAYSAEAYESLAKGDREKAAKLVGMALELDPVQPTALQIFNRIDGKGTE